MATKSIFDCDELDARHQPTRQQITYDDDDWLAFGDATDQVDKPLNNVSISVSFTPIDDNRMKNGKRKANISRLENGRIFKAAKLNVQNITVTANGASRKAAKTNKNTDEYELLREIGSGTYGRVFKAKWNVTNEMIAIKRMICKLNTASTEKNLDFTKREYDNLMEMHACNYIVRLLKGREKQIAINDLQIDLLFEYCPYDLKKIISKPNITFKLEEIKTFLRQILTGLAFMHKKLIMHRDLKTENILVTADGVAKIADFGLSRKMNDPNAMLEKQKFTPNVVTQWYRAPELLFGDPHYNESVDLWSFGCVMGEFWYRTAILQGANEIHQIRLISKLCGPLTPQVWPNIVKSKIYQQISESLSENKRITRTFLKQKPPIVKDDQANNLFDKLLGCNPEKRLNASNALNDDLFYSDPLPVKSLEQFMKKIIPALNSM